MLVSGGQILAIDQVYTDNRTISGDGVQKPLGVKTDIIATNATVSSVSSKLEQNIDYVSGHLPTVTAGKNVGVEVSATPDGRPLYIVSADDVEQREIHIIGNNGVSATFNETTSSWNIGVSANYLSANALNNYYNKTQVDDKLTATSSWANGKFQEKGNYVSASDFNQFKTDVNAALDKKQDVSAMTAYAQSAWVNDNYQKKGNYVSADDFDEYKTQVSQEFANTSSWATGKFQEKGDYISATEFNEYKEQVDNEFESTSAWANETFQAKGDYVSATEFDDYKTEVSQEFTNTSAWARDTFQEKGEYVSATDFEDYKEKVEQEFENISAWAEDTFQKKGDYLSANALDDISGKWESVYDTTVTASGNWNEASAFAANSAKFVTSAGVEFNPDLAYFLKKQENESVAWEGVDLSDLGKMYNISSLTPDLISAGISADEQNNPIYVVSAAEPGEVVSPGISGENGVSAHYDVEKNTYIIGLSGSPAYASFTATTTADDGVYTPATYSESYNVGNGVTLEDNTISVGPGLWHVTIYAKVTNAEVSPNYYDTVLTCNSIKNIVQFDNSYIHTEYINLDADIVSNDSLTINVKLEDVPENSTVVIEQLQLHRIVTGSVVNEGGNTYTPGDGISIDNYQIDFNAGDGLAVDTATNNVNVQAGSGIFVDANNKLSIKLGQGLAFSADGDVVAIETDSEVKDVVETVETLKNELDGKLTTNMNVSDAQYIIDPLAGTTKSNIAAATLFTVPLQHNITSSTQISFFTTDTLPQNAAEYPFIFGLYEYNFDYIVAANDPDHNNISSRSQTKWVADTGPIWWDTLDEYRHTLAVNKGKFTFTFKNVASEETSTVTGLDGTEYVNEFAPCMRSDRAYYLVLFARGKGNISNRLLGDNGYAGGINETDPQISFRLESEETVPYIYPDETTATMNAQWYSNIRENNLNISLSGIPYWTTAYRHTNDVNGIGRPYVMIRNPRL